MPQGSPRPRKESEGWGLEHQGPGCTDIRSDLHSEPAAEAEQRNPSHRPMDMPRTEACAGRISLLQSRSEEVEGREHGRDVSSQAPDSGKSLRSEEKPNGFEACSYFVREAYGDSWPWSPWPPCPRKTTPLPRVPGRSEAEMSRSSSPHSKTRVESFQKGAAKAPLFRRSVVFAAHGRGAQSPEQMSTVEVQISRLAKSKARGR
jgi:hypothetical protein